MKIVAGVRGMAVSSAALTARLTVRLPHVNGAKNSTWAVDREASTAEFSIRFLTATKTSDAFGEAGSGILFDGEDLSAAAVEATMEVSSVDTGNETRDERIQEREDSFEAGTLPEKRVTVRRRATG